MALSLFNEIWTFSFEVLFAQSCHKGCVFSLKLDARTTVVGDTK